MDKLKVGLVGIGGMGSVHYDCYGSIEDAEVVAVCEARPELAKEKTAGKNVKIYSDLNEMLSSEALDVVDICTPSYMHADMAIECLKRGFNVLCEKPMTLTEDDCERVLQAVKVSGKKFMTAHVVRFMASYAYLKETLNSKKYGSLVELSLRRLSAVPSWSWNDWMRNEKLSGGVCLDLCVHDLDFVQSALGMPQKTYSVLRPLRDNSSFFRCEMNYGDFTVSCEASWFNADFPFSAEFVAVFDNGYLQLKEGRLYENGKEVCLGEKRFSEVTGLNISGDNAYLDEIAYFIDCVKNGKTVDFIKGESSARSVSLACKLINEAVIL